MHSTSKCTWYVPLSRMSLITPEMIFSLRLFSDTNFERIFLQFSWLIVNFFLALIRHQSIHFQSDQLTVLATVVIRLLFETFFFLFDHVISMVKSFKKCLSTLFVVVRILFFYASEDSCEKSLDDLFVDEIFLKFGKFKKFQKIFQATEEVHFK